MTTHDSVAGISRHFTSDEIEALVITAAEAVCGNLDDLSTRQAGLAERAYRLLMDEIYGPPGAGPPPPRAAVPAEIWVLRHDDKHGDDVSLHASHESALGALAQTVRSRWDNITGIPGVPATGDGLDDETAVATYFSRRSGLESYSLYSEGVNGIHAGTCPGGTGDLDDKLSQLSSQCHEGSQQIALLSMLAIARITRATLPDAAAVCLAWSDQGPYLIPDGGYLTRDGQRIAEDASFSEDSLDNAISLYCASLGEDNEGTWQAFTSTGTAGQTYHLKLDDVLASAEPGIRQLAPGQPSASVRADRLIVDPS
jgi:hypothetical protein